MAYLGHVYFYVAHHHPVLLVFCQLLVDSRRNQFVESLSTEGITVTYYNSQYTL